MTREEAIEILQNHHMWTGEPQELIDVRKANKALNMAISALEQTDEDDYQTDMDEAWEERIDYHDDFATALKKISDYKRINKMTDEEVYKRFVEPYHKFNKSEPCEDAVSRDAVIDALSEYVSLEEYEDNSHTFTVKPLIKRIVKLPSITQKLKTGHWIEKDGFDGDVYYDCSECGESWATIEGTPWDNEWKYCPNCGCRMVEPQESEDKE